MSVPTETLTASRAEARRISKVHALVNWLHLAAHPATVRRALMTTVIVGTVLITINHGDALLRGEVDGVRLAKMLLTLAVP
ncbi:MAG: nitrate/nitrite transporter NrtS, partial [candidate division KSB1 bacterium]